MADQEDVDVNDPRSWDYAKRYARLLGPVPSSVSDSVKVLWEDHNLSREKGEVFISDRSFAVVKRIEKSSMLKMPLFFAAQALYKERLHEIREDDMSRALVRVLHPGLFAALLGLVYMHRRFNKIVAGDVWNELSKEYILHMELGFRIGKASGDIGDAIGVLLGGIRTAALACLLKHNEESLVGYRNLKKKQLDIEFEHGRWGCDHGQIAAFLLRSMGYCGDQMIGGYGIRGHAPGDLIGEYRSWRAVTLFMDGFKSGQPLEEVDVTESGLTILPTERKEMQNQIEDLVQKGSSFNWMFKGTKKPEE